MIKHGLLTLLACATITMAQENYSTWQAFKTITINTSANATGANLGNGIGHYPLLVRLTSANADVFSQAAAKGADIRFTKKDGVTRLPHQRERWDAVNQVAEFWVQVDTINAGDSTQSIRMYWGKAGAADSSQGSQVFNTSNGFGAVWHLGDSTGINPRPNQVSGGPVATLQNWTTSGPVPGVIGLADSLGAGGVCDAITTAGKPYIDLNVTRTSYAPYNTLSAGTGFTWSAWYFDSTGTSDAGARFLIAAADSTVVSANGRVIIFRPNADNRTLTTRWGTNGSPISTDPKVTLQGRTWQYLTVTKATGNVGTTFYTNGVLDGSGTALGSSTDANRLYVEVGRDNCATTSDNYLSGKVDEMQLSNVVRDSNWVKLSFQSQCNSTVTSCPTTSPIVLGISQNNVTAPTIVTSPASQATTIGSSVNFTVAATGTTPLVYVWLHTHGGTTDTLKKDTLSTLTDTLKLTNVPLADTGSFKVTVTNSAASVTSGSATLTLTAGPAITSSPASASVVLGSSVKFGVTVSGSSSTPLTYKWMHLHGGITDTLKKDTTSLFNDSIALTNVPLGDTGSYEVAVSNSAGSVTSLPGVLSVYTVPSAPTNVTVKGVSGQITIYWNTPANGGSAITSYKVVATTDTSKHCTATTADSCVVAVTSNTTVYTFTVVAINAAGTGAAATSPSVSNILSFNSKNGFSLQMAGSQMLLRMPLIVGDVHVAIFDIWGRTVWSRTVSGDISQLTWNGNSNQGSAAQVGMYVLRVTFQKGVGNPASVIQTTFVKQ